MIGYRFVADEDGRVEAVELAREACESLARVRALMAGLLSEVESEVERGDGGSALALVAARFDGAYSDMSMLTGFRRDGDDFDLPMFSQCQVESTLWGLLSVEGDLRGLVEESASWSGQGSLAVFKESPEGEALSEAVTLAGAALRRFAAVAHNAVVEAGQGAR